MAGVVIKLALQFAARDVLFSTIYDRFAAQPEAKVGFTNQLQFSTHQRNCTQAQFLELLMPMIQEDQITSLSPIAMQDFVQHYQALGRLDVIEQCIMHLDIANLDIHQVFGVCCRFCEKLTRKYKVVVMCWTHGLYDGILFVYTHGLLDFTTPLQELLRIVIANVRAAAKVSSHFPPPRNCE